MKKLVFLALCSVFTVTMYAQGNKNKDKAAATAQPSKTNVTVAELEKKLAAGNILLIDVRTPEEYKEGHIHNAVNIDYQSADFEKQVAKLDKTKPVAVYCRSGKRSTASADILQAARFQTIYNLEGGIMQWMNAGKPTEK